MGRIYESMADMIGNTPILHLKRFEDAVGAKAGIFAKLEGYNPAGSAKDRVALRMIEDYEKAGVLKPGSVIIEPTSGNTGIGLAAVAAIKGYEAIIVMPDTMSPERQRIMAAYGARIVLSDGTLGMRGAIALANEIKRETPDSIIAGQFENPSNPEAHYDTTGPEIYEAMDKEVDVFVSAVGTGGTISGVGRYLKEKDPKIKIIAVEPAASPYLSEGKAGPHGIQGIGAGFTPETLDTDVYDEVITVTDADAYEGARRLARIEGLLVGMSSGAALVAAERLAKREELAGKNVVVLFPDGGERYLSTKLFT